MLRGIKAALLAPVVLYLLVDLAAKGLQFLFLPSASHILDIEAYGKLTLILSLLTALAPIVSLSSEAAYSVFFNQIKENDKVKLFIGCALVALSGFIFFISLIFLMSSIDDKLFFKVLSLREDVTLICVIVFFEFFITLSLLTKRLNFHKFKYFISYFFYILSKFIVGVSSIYFFESTSVYLVAILVNNIVFAMLFLFITFSVRDILAEVKSIQPTFYKKVLNYSIIILPVTLFSVVNSLVDKVYVANLLTITDLANYTSIFLLAGALQIVILAINKSYMPKLLKAYSINGYSALNLIKKDTLNFLKIVFLCFVIFVFLSPFIFQLLFDEGIQFSPEVFVLLLLAFSFNAIYILYTNILSLEEKTAKFKMIGFLIAVCINIPLSYVLTFKFGVLGAAVSTMISTIVAASVLYVFVSNVIFRFYLLKVNAIFIISLLLVSFSILYFDLYKYIGIN